uniref:Uncharacterized protein n=1 Tax=Parascaris equorum TaxID=6256 RepID=A0A914RI28_PAREQ
MRAGLFEGPQILSQLECSGMMSVLKLMHQGYPSSVQLFRRRESSFEESLTDAGI